MEHDFDIATCRACGYRYPETPALPSGWDTPTPNDLLYEAWCVIANVGHKQGGWDEQDPEWVAAAERWRDRWQENRSHWRYL